MICFPIQIIIRRGSRSYRESFVVIIYEILRKKDIVSFSVKDFGFEPL